MRTRSLSIAAVLLAAAMPFTSLPAATVTDAAGDLLATYTGPAGGDLDILSANAYFDGTNYRLSATLNGAVGTTANSLYVFGINRGAGTERLTLGVPAVVIDRGHRREHKWLSLPTLPRPRPDAVQMLRARASGRFRA